MNLRSFKQYVRYTAPLIIVAVIASSVLVAPFYNVQTAKAASWKTYTICQREAALSSDDTYFTSCLNNQSIEGMVFRAYDAVLNRDPDSAGFKYWVSVANNAVANGQNPTSVVVSKMMGTAEYKNSAWAKIANHAHWVKLLYSNVLNRHAGASEAYYWADLMTRDTRGGQKRWTRPQVAAFVLQSAEAKSVSRLTAPCYITNYDSRYCAD